MGTDQTRQGKRRNEPPFAYACWRSRRPLWSTCGIWCPKLSRRMTGVHPTKESFAKDGSRRGRAV